MLIRRVVFSSVLNATVMGHRAPRPRDRRDAPRDPRPASGAAVPGDKPGRCESETTPPAERFPARCFPTRGSESAAIGGPAFVKPTFVPLRDVRDSGKPLTEPLHTLLMRVPPAQACTRSVQYSFDRSQTPTADLTAGAGGLSCKGRVQGPPRGGSGERRRPHAASARACFCLEHGSCIIELRLCHTCVRLVVTKIRHAEGIHGLREVASVADHRRCCALRT